MGVILLKEKSKAKETNSRAYLGGKQRAKKNKRTATSVRDKGECSLPCTDCMLLICCQLVGPT